MGAVWDEVAKNTLINAWRKLWLHDLSKDDDNKEGFPGFQLSAETQIITKLVDYSRQVAESGNFALEESDVTEMLEAEEDFLVINSYIYDEIAQMVLNNADGSDEETDEEVEIVNNQIKGLTNDECIAKCNELLVALESREYISEQDIMGLYKIQQKLVESRPSASKQLKITIYFKRINIFSSNAKKWIKSLLHSI